MTQSRNSTASPMKRPEYVKAGWHKELMRKAEFNILIGVRNIIVKWLIIDEMARTSLYHEKPNYHQKVVKASWNLSKREPVKR